MLTRRELIMDSLVASAFPVAKGIESLTIGSSESTAATPKRTITFEEALADKSLRENHIRQTLEQLFGGDVYTYIQNVYYDHDRSKIKQRKEKMIERFGTDVTEAHAGMVSNPQEFGKKKKSDLYAFGEMFSTIKISIGGRYIEVAPTESRIIAQLEHEFLHAKHNFEGIKLENGLLIDSLNYPKIKPEVVGFVEESIGYIKQVEIGRHLEKPNRLYLLLNQFEKLPPSYLLAIYSLGTFLQKAERLIKPEDIPIQDIVYIVHQLRQIKRRVPEMEVFPFTKTLYKRFGIK